jgi:hypothetical protein
MSDLGLTATWGREDWSPVLIEGLRQQSALGRAGARIIPIKGKSGHVPRILVDPEADWVDELEELPSDAGDADTIELVPKKLGNVVTLSEESVEDAPVNELDSVGDALIRGTASKVDATFFSDAPAAVNPAKPAGLLDYTLPGTTGDVDLETLIAGLGAINGEGGNADTVFLSSADETGLILAALAGKYAISDYLGAQRVIAPLPAGTAVICQASYIAVGVARKADVKFSEHAAFTRDGLAAKVTMRVDWEPADPAAFYVITPAP